MKLFAIPIEFDIFQYDEDDKTILINALLHSVSGNVFWFKGKRDNFLQIKAEHGNKAYELNVIHGDYIVVMKDPYNFIFSFPEEEFVIFIQE